MHRLAIVQAPGAMQPSATAIAIESNDHYIQDSIVFSSLVGLHVIGAANMVTGLHVWFPNNVAGSFGKLFCLSL